jgi:hypothetical protein
MIYISVTNIYKQNIEEILMSRRDEVSGDWRILHNEMCY